MIVAIIIMVIGVVGLMVKFKKVPPGAAGALGALGLSGGAAKVEKEERPPTWADLLRLSGLSGTPARRLAIVNNKTLGVGETARVEVEGEKIRIVCHEIRTKSAVFQVEGAGEPFELFLREDAGVSSNAVPAFVALAAKSHTNKVRTAALPVALDGEQVRALANRIPTNPIVELDAVLAPAGSSGAERVPAVQ